MSEADEVIVAIRDLVVGSFSKDFLDLRFSGREITILNFYVVCSIYYCML